MDKFPRKPSGESFLKFNLPIYSSKWESHGGRKPRIAKCGAFIFVASRNTAGMAWLFYLQGYSLSVDKVLRFLIDEIPRKMSGEFIVQND